MLNRLRRRLRRGASRKSSSTRVNSGTAVVTNSEFVTLAYRLVLDRDPDPDGLANFEALLRQGTSHRDVIALMRESDEYTESHRPGLDNDDFIMLTYQMLLDRSPDDHGLAHHHDLLDKGYTHSDVVALLRESDEYRMRGLEPLHRLHASRVQWTTSLPTARVIVDLGGASTSSPNGAMIELGYPYPFDSLTIIDLPPEERHAEFRSERWPDRVDTKLGPVHYVHASMTDLSRIADGTVDLVNSAQTFEHIYPDEGVLLLKEARRVLRSDGYLALDTPNRALTEIQLRDADEEFINPDHKIEYTQDRKSVV